jgi:hypothetical protein
LSEVLKFHRDMKPIKDQRFQHARTGENAPQPGTTIGEGRQHGVLISTNRIEAFPDQPLDVRPCFRDAAENLTQLSYQTKKYDSKSKYCRAWTDLGTTHAEVD